MTNFIACNHPSKAIKLQGHFWFCLVDTCTIGSVERYFSYV